MMFISLLIAPLVVNALECKQKIFVPALNAIGNAHDTLAKSSVTKEELKSLQTIKITKTTYKEDIAKLHKELAFLKDKKHYALEAQKINSNNLKTWMALEKSCQGDDKLAAKKVKDDVIRLQKIIEQRVMTIERYIKRIEMSISIGERKYSPNKE